VAGLILSTAGGAAARVSQPTLTPQHASRYAPGELVVRYRPGTTREVRRDFRSDLGATVETRSLLKGSEVLDLPSGVSVTDAVEEARSLPSVLYAEPNYSIANAASPNDPLFDEMWSLGLGNDEGFNSGIDTPRVWNLTTGSSDVTVAVVDSGIESAHPDLAPNMWANPAEVPSNGADDDHNGMIDDITGWDWVAGDNAPEDELGHGTQVAGIIGARGNNNAGVAGVSWDVRLMSLRVLDAAGSGWTSDVADAFTYAGRMGADVVNASLAGPDFSEAMLAAIAGAPDTLFVVAAGNASINVDQKPSYPCSFPLANIICVGATGQSQQLSAYSNFGTTAVDLAAPGDAILSTWPGGTYNEGWGTSFASPHVAGVAGLLKARHPEATASDLKNAILAGTDGLPSLVGRTAAGQLSAAGAFEQMGDVVPQEPHQISSDRDEPEKDKRCSTRRRSHRNGAKGRRSRHGLCRARSNRSR
jgi:subtilisin family serine protease